MIRSLRLDPADEGYLSSALSEGGIEPSHSFLLYEQLTLIPRHILIH